MIGICSYMIRLAGMTKPGKEDISHKGDDAESTFNKLRTSEDSSNWCFSPLDEVKSKYGIDLLVIIPKFIISKATV